MKATFIVLAALSTMESTVFGYKILCVFPAPSRSHHMLAKGIVNTLVDAGHQVTWVTPFLEKSTSDNLKLIELTELRKVAESVQVKSDDHMTLSQIFMFARQVSVTALNSTELQEVLVKENFDAVVTEWFFSDLEAGYAAVQQVPWIVLNGVVMQPYMEYLVDSVRTLPAIPFMMNDFPVPMNFWQRLINTFGFGVFMFSTWRDSSLTSSLYEKHFSQIAAARGVPLPLFSNALHNISILFVNSHSSFAPAQGLPPNVIEIGGYHIEETTPPLPKDLQELLDSSPNGVVYFSMGSLFKSATLPENTKRDLVRIFGQLPYTVLWKFEEKLDGLPENLHIRPWMPQTSILAHPNVRLFITHGGLLSTLESLRYGVPVLAVPMFGDQPGNANRAVRAGYALKVALSANMAPELEEALHHMLTNDSYYNKAKELSKLFNNRPVKQRQLISHYVELAIESKGAYHLRSKSLLYKWYQLWMLDQLAVVGAALFLLYLLLKKIISGVVKKTVKQEVKKGKKNK